MSAPQVTDATLDSVNEVRLTLAAKGCDHRIYIEPPAEWDAFTDGLYVTGHREAGLDSCAFVHTDGEIQWLR